MNINKLAEKFDKLKNKAKTHSYLSVTDDRSINVECCLEVIKFEENLIALRLARSIIRIVGFDLEMRNYSDDCVNITGKICSIGFEEYSERKK